MSNATICCSKPHCHRVFHGDEEWVQLDTPGEPMRAFCDLKCLYVYLRQRFFNHPRPLT